MEKLHYGPELEMDSKIYLLAHTYFLILMNLSGYSLFMSQLMESQIFQIIGVLMGYSHLLLSLCQLLLQIP